MADLFLPTPYGLSALVGCLLGYATGMATRGLVRSSWWLPPVVAAAATAAGMGAYAILGAVLGDPGMLKVYLVPALVVGTPSAALLAVPVAALRGVGGARARARARCRRRRGDCGEVPPPPLRPGAAQRRHPAAPAPPAADRSGVVCATPCGGRASTPSRRPLARRVPRSPAGPACGRADRSSTGS